MKIVIIHGQSHEGSTCMVARELAGKVGGEIREFFLPRDLTGPAWAAALAFKQICAAVPILRRWNPSRRPSGRRSC